MAQIRPFFDRILVKRTETETTTPGGIIIPDSVQDNKTQTGTVQAIGEGKLLADGKIRPIGVNVGSKVLFGKYSGTEVAIDGQNYVILREEEVLAELCDTKSYSTKSSCC
jgi:chaperonin GroES